MTRCGAVVEGKPTLVLIVGMKNDPNWWLGNYFPFWGRPIFRRHGFMLVSGRVSGYRSRQAISCRILSFIKDRSSGVWFRPQAVKNFQEKKREKKLSKKRLDRWMDNSYPWRFFLKCWKTLSGWWFQPISNIISQIGNLPQVGVQIKNIWNHHLDFYWCDRARRWT